MRAIQDSRWWARKDHAVECARASWPEPTQAPLDSMLTDVMRVSGVAALSDIPSHVDDVASFEFVHTLHAVISEIYREIERGLS